MSFFVFCPTFDEELKASIKVDRDLMINFKEELNEVDFKDKLWKAYFDFNESRTGTRWIKSTQKMFFNMDASPGNVIIREGKPVYIDPDAWTWTEWDLFIQKIRLDDMVWFNEYIKYGFRTHE